MTGCRSIGASKKTTGMKSPICHHGRPLTKLASLEFSSYLASNLTTRELPFPNNYITYITLGKVLWTSVPFRSFLSLVNFLRTVNFTYFLNFSKPLSQGHFALRVARCTTGSTLETPRGEQLVSSASGPLRERGVVAGFQYRLYIFV